MLIGLFGPRIDACVFFLPTMMNNAAQQQQRAQGPMADFDFGEYIANAAGNDSHHHQQGLDIYGEYAQQRNPHLQVHMDSHLAAQSQLASHNRTDQLAQGPSQGAAQSLISAEMLSLKGRLEQQMKLQQQVRTSLSRRSALTVAQIELISGQPSVNAQQKDALFHGLLTPGPSAELPAVVPKDLVPPMMLQAAEMFTSNPSANVRRSPLTCVCH